MTEYREKLKYPEGAVGVAVGVGPKVVCVDVFDKPATCRKVWDRLLTGTIMDALEPGADAEVPPAEEVRKILTALQDAPWQQGPAIGAGEEFRAKFADDRQATALVLDGTVVHGSMVAGG